MKAQGYILAAPKLCISSSIGIGSTKALGYIHTTHNIVGEGKIPICLSPSILGEVKVLNKKTTIKATIPLSISCDVEWQLLCPLRVINDLRTLLQFIGELEPWCGPYISPHIELKVLKDMPSKNPNIECNPTWKMIRVDYKNIPIALLFNPHFIEEQSLHIISKNMFADMVNHLRILGNVVPRGVNVQESNPTKIYKELRRVDEYY